MQLEYNPWHYAAFVVNQHAPIAASVFITLPIPATLFIDYDALSYALQRTDLPAQPHAPEAAKLRIRSGGAAN
jgi:hypothetical protein